MPHNAFILQSLTVARRGSAYDPAIDSRRSGLPKMTYPYDVLTAACLFIIVASAAILLIVS